MQSIAAGCGLSTSKMSEEQSNFKVTDRRLFNADGTPREVEREEAPAPEAATNAAAPSSDEPTSSATEATASTSAAATRAEEPRPSENREPATAATADSASALDQQEELGEEGYGESDIPGANDPASFINFLMSIASNAAAALGMMEHPVTGQRGVDLPLGKHWIDVLGMLEEKTRGNLAPQEQQIFTGLLSDLRMQYISLTRAPAPKRPGGFTGSDILGGK